MNSLSGAVVSKTVWLGLAITILGFLQTQSSVLATYFKPETWGLVNMGMGLAIIILRFFTTQSLSDKGA